MARTVGFIEILTAVTREFDTEIRETYPGGEYSTGAKWNKAPTRFLSYRALMPFLNRIEARLKERFGKSADDLDIRPTKSELMSLYAQPAQQTVLYVAALVLKALAVSSDAKII